VHFFNVSTTAVFIKLIVILIRPRKSENYYDSQNSLSKNRRNWKKKSERLIASRKKKVRWKKPGGDQKRQNSQIELGRN
jgi:hypothetical protein